MASKRISIVLDLEVSPTATFRIMYVFVILHHKRREIVHFNATYHPTAEWAAQQLVEAFPFDMAPRYLIRDRDSIYGARFRNRVKSLGTEEMLAAPRSPWQNPYVERIIGSIRRECLNHVIILNKRHLRRQLKSYSTYYYEATLCPWGPRSGFEKLRHYRWLNCWQWSKRVLDR